LLISTVITDPADLEIPAIAKISAAAFAACAVVASVPPNADALSFSPRRNVNAEFIDYTGHFVAWHTRILNARQETFFGYDVTMADSTGLHFNSYLSCARSRNRALYDLKVSATFGNLCDLHRR
jgi:hypothetical protein